MRCEEQPHREEVVSLVHRTQNALPLVLVGELSPPDHTYSRVFCLRFGFTFAKPNTLHRHQQEGSKAVEMAEMKHYYLHY